ncbi:protein son of sevenless isoform X1 [Pieris rapae]|uniref:protein son of sevenless isoform X1 n=1 Tax=Pieris rapae TaxID=64459 RepID=UPI001E27FD55|nr:protein son of sevenless isoform X1 [Pieris rapae]
MLPTVEESRGYDFQDPENVDKWKGLFLNSFKKILENLHPTLTAEESGLEFVESLCLRLLSMLCAIPAPVTIQDVEERVSRTFPTPLDRWALQEARDVQKKRKLLLPADKLHHLLQKEVLPHKIDPSVTGFMIGILEYISTDVLRLSGTFVKKISQKSGYLVITSSDIKTAMCADKLLMDMFYQESELAGVAAGVSALDRGRRASLTYGELVRDLLADERNFLRDLNLIIRVFKDEIEKIISDTWKISLIFGNIVDIYELTVTLLGNLEDAMEMSQDSPQPYIGSCFEELAEVEEFRAYVRYANIVTRKESRDALQEIVDNPEYSERLDTAGHGFRLAVKYYLPKLLLTPVSHVFLYHSYVLALLQIAPTSDDRESFKQVECNLHPIKKLLTKALGNGPKIDTAIRGAARARRQLAIEKCNELGKLIDNWDTKDVPQCCNEFIREDTLSKLGPGKRVAERRAFLFDGLLLLCKPSTSIVSVTVNSNAASGGPQQLKLKEKLHIRKLEIVDKIDCEVLPEGRNLMELTPRIGGPIVLSAASAAEKRNWMCDLVMLNTKPMLDRSLDSILLELERRHPLKLPPVSLYRFAEPDSPDNIVLEERAGPTPLIKGATLLKLVERLTYHIYADLNLVRTFLTTYRSFCSPAELLDLLIERFHIPEPSEVYDTPRTSECVEEMSASSDAEKLSKNTAREDWKRYRKEFQQPVKFRVINVLRHWVDQHFYDFERDPALLEKLKEFLESVDGKPMKKWVQSVLKIVQRKSFTGGDTDSLAGGVAHVFDRLPPATCKHVADPDRYNWHPLALHPLEMARQLTLLEFQLYKQVKPSELVGAVWTKKDKEKTSPNLLKIIKHTTNFTRWMEKWVVESENGDERAGVIARFLEMAVCLRDLNNFNGVLAVVAACGSASVHRLRNTFQLVPLRLLRALEQFRALNSDHFKRYQERLRSINPPCVPFCGIYLTNILHIEEGNLDYLPNSQLINFSKRRKVAEITGEIQQYQNQPYCLTVEPRTRMFLETLDPFPGMDDNEVTNYLYNKSLEIEPRPPTKPTPKFPRKYPELSVKPVKIRRSTEHHQSSSNISSNEDTLSVAQLSPTSICTWDGASLASLPINQDDRSERSLTSPRLERSSSSSLAQLGQLSLFDKLAFFDKSKSVATLNNTRNSMSARDEPPSPRDNHSPRHDRCNSTSCVSNMTSSMGTVRSRGAALSPRGAIVDAELFYSRSMDHLACKRNEQERVPPLLPRHSALSSTTSLADHEPPPPPPHHHLHSLAGTSDTPDIDKPLPSPKNPELFRSPAMSPKRSPAPPPPGLLNASPLHLDRPPTFSFPSATSPSSLQQSCESSSCGTPPPLPPRRRRDSAATPTLHHGSWLDSSPSAAGNSPPPLPPRPPPAPELLRPQSSALLQRRHHSAGLAPRLPPKPPPPAVAPRT